ncbi:hypothetical protein, partial [Nocardia abscessus]|uniref:hypothetical protein n=1 Tax=Nocardia abscessus TaxID=120957 RepID=UPI00245797B9
MALALRPVDPIPVLGAVIAAVRRITARYRLTTQEKRNQEGAPRRPAGGGYPAKSGAGRTKQ